MGLLLKGYMLEPPRVGGGNSPFTFTPNNLITNQSAFDTAYPSDESAPRTEYLVFVRKDGDIPDAVFCWTKNEVIQRFDHEGRVQRFKTLPGSSPTAVGVVATDANTNRLKVVPPVSTDFSSFPIRLSVGPDSGTTLTISTVANEGAFGSPSPGTVELALDTGSLNWNTSDITTYLGEPVQFQQQSFFGFDESNGRLGQVDDTLLLNPIPDGGQFPLIRIGFDEFLTPVEKASEGGFSVDPTAGTVEWARSTGRLKFNSGDVSSNTGRAVYYEGACFEFSLQVTPTSVGTVASPTSISPVRPNSDTFFAVPGVVQFEQTVFVDAFDPIGFLGQVQVRNSDGAVQFSLADQFDFGGFGAVVYIPDLFIERGITLRLFRTPIDPAAIDPDAKDVSAFYFTNDAVLANPIIGHSEVHLPATPTEAAPITVKVSQGTGFFTGTLPRLDVPSPPNGIGYIIDFPQRKLKFGKRRSNVVFPQTANKPYGTVQLSDPMVFLSNLVLELETSPGSGLYNTLTLNEDVTFDSNSGLATLMNTVGETKASSSTGAFSGTSFTDTTQDFVTSSVATNDLLVVLSGTPKGVYTITGVGATTLTTDLPGGTANHLLYEVHHGSETLADRYFKDIPPLDPNTVVERINSLGTVTNSPRLAIPIDRIPVSRFRLGKTVFMTTSTVANDGSFGSPPAGTVEVSLDTGNLNFSTGDLGKTVYWAKGLQVGTDFKTQPAIGFVQLTDRLLASEEVLITYAVLDSHNNKVSVQERATFAVRKELTQSHPIPTSTLSFNPLGREIATTPPARAFRGGRPQVTGKTVTFDYAHSTVTFLADNIKVDPNVIHHGVPIQPTERVYIDYSVYEAIGGETSFTVARPPMLGVTVLISDGTSSFKIAGDRTTEFPPTFLLKVDRSEVYLLGTPTYDPVADATTVNLAAPQTFRSDFQNPSLAVTSGQTRIAPSFALPSYFITELASYETVARGNKTMKFVGDVAGTYVGGVVVHWTNGSDIFDFNIVEGSTYDQKTNRTQVTFAANGAHQYDQSSVTLKRSTNPILANSLASVSTARTPDLTLPYLVFRRIEGQVGQVLVQPNDFNIDVSGNVTFATPLRDNEALVICYTGARIISDGRSFRASYSHLIIPNATNGLAGQVLTMDYTTFSPDTFYWRIEKITTMRAELAAKYQSDAQSSIPSGGPLLQNSSSPPLHSQGRESLFFQEEHLANEDYVARKTLVFFNTGINYLEDALRSMDGRVIGDHNGRFLFDGNIDNPIRNTLGDVTNQIDDLLKVADGPVTITFPPFVVTFLGTYKAMYQPSKFSRFYPTRRNLYGVAASPSGLDTGDTILDLGFQSLAAVNIVYRRQPWAIVTQAAPLGSTTVDVDNADGSKDLLRPEFDPSTYDHRVAITAQDGTVLVPAASPITVASKTTTSLTFTFPLLVDVPVGATVFQVLSDASPPMNPFPKVYRLGFDVGAKLDDGVLTHIEPFPPFDGSVPGFPPELVITNPAGGEVLDVKVDLNNKLTEPYRFPALDGGTEDDDGNRQFPILSPRLDSEGGLNVGYLFLEQNIIQPSTGTLRTATTNPYVGTGSLDATKLILTNSVNWPSPIPKIYDLVEIRTGLNALSGYHRIVSVGVNNLTVDAGQPFSFVDSGFTFAVTVSNTLVTSATGTVSPSNILTDTFVDFVASGVQRGHTVVITSGGFAGLRRQVLSVDSSTQLTITALPADTSASYRVDESLSTFGDAPGSILDGDLVSALDGELAYLDTNTRPSDPDSERIGIEQFFDHFFTDIVTSSTGQTFSTNVLHDASVDFIAAGVDSTLFVYIRSGSDEGVYKVDSVTGPNDLNITATFPTTTTGVSYRIVHSEGLKLKALKDAFSALQTIDQAITDTNTFLSLITTGVTVLADPSAHATRTTKSDLDNRSTQVSSRISDISDSSGPAAKIKAVLASSGKLYDKRYVWIDARINLEKGILPKQERAVSDRLKAMKDILKQLTKLETTTP